MLKVILDTNVLISSLIQRNYPYLIVNHCIIENSVNTCVSDKLIEEYFTVINRPKFSKYPDFLNRAEFVLTQIIDQSLKFTPSSRVDILKDKNDNFLLELASESQADYLITGNTSDFSIDEFLNTKIINPKDFWELISDQK